MDTPRRVLIVEDDAHIAELLRLHLREDVYKRQTTTCCWTNRATSCSP